jgi:signal transduction histidine kinase/ActR/RegA family two-component response regulator
MNTDIRISFLWAIILLSIPLLLLSLLLVLFFLHRQKGKRFQEELQNRTSELEAQVERAQTAASVKSSFLSRMSHEIRTPLNAIIGVVQIIRDMSLKDKLKEYMEIIEDNSKHLMGIINDILDFSKIESGNLILEEECFSLRRNIDFLNSMFQGRANVKGLFLSIETLDIKHDGIVADRLRLNQVLINLLSNAIKFTDEGGKVTLIVQEIAHMNEDSVYRFTVQDNGIGIDPEQAKRLFTPFIQANAGVSRVYGGTGLGLSISQSIVRMMGGEIEIETVPGEGSIFQFTIQVRAEVDAPKAQVVTTKLPDKLRGKRILIVDDIDINREIMAALLESGGAILEMAEDGKKAFEAFCTSELNQYDLILMDMFMPVMDGCTATEKIRACERADAKTVRIVAMTANVMKEEMEKAFTAGMNGYLSKPVEMEILCAKLEEWL